MVLIELKRKRGRASVSAGFIARKMGIRSSTYLRGILAEMESVGLIEHLWTGGRTPQGDAVKTWRLAEYENTPLPERYIVINGMSMRAL